jgi:hypothetical protein
VNYFAHALPFLDDPYYVAGTGVPDWLTVVDRQVRVRTQQAEPCTRSADPQTAAVARGLSQHIRDDLRFHVTRAFAETSLELTVAARQVLAEASDFRPSFLGHILVEVLLDAALTVDHPDLLDAYFQALESVDPGRVQEIVSLMASRPTDRLAPMIHLFCRERVLWDYLEDDRLMVRLNQVMRRVGFGPLPPEFTAILPAARQLVTRRRRELLEGIPA